MGYRNLPVLLLLTIAGRGVAAAAPNNTAALNACQQLQSEAHLQVFLLGSPQYETDIEHYLSSSMQQAACSVEPRTAQEIGVVLGVIGQNRAPFAVKSGGHAFNQNFSSTTGVQISMVHFNETMYSSGNSSVRVGSGTTWDRVYSIVNPLGVNVVGGRVQGVGVGGFLLGGGYSWLTNEHGLAIDNILAMELVTPAGDVVEVTQNSQPDLYFALRGGYNNFGIVTSFTLKAFPQGNITGGTLLYDDAHFDAYSAAISNFTSNSRDPKAQAISTILTSNGTTSISVLLYYNGLNVPNGTFDGFFAIPAVSNDFKQRSFLDFLLTNFQPGGISATSGTVAMLEYSKTLLEQMHNQTIFWTEKGEGRNGIGGGFNVEPFLPSIHTHSPSEAAYPHAPNLPLLPTEVNFGWIGDSAEDEAFWIDATEQATQVIYEQALREGQNIDAKNESQIRYGNYALAGTPIEMIWGTNIARLRSIQKKVDPKKVMSLTGGWKL